MKKTVLLTQESYDALKKELEYMKTEGAKEVAEAIKRFKFRGCEHYAVCFGSLLAL